MYRRSTTETIMHPIGQNILLIYPHFGIAFIQPPQFVNSEDSETVKLDHFLYSLRNIIQTPTGKCISSLPGRYPDRNGYLLNLFYFSRFKIYRKTLHSDDHVRVVIFQFRPSRLFESVELRLRISTFYISTVEK